MHNLKYDSFRHYVQTHFGSVLVVSFFVGLFTPGLDSIPTNLVAPLLAVVIFFSTSKATRSDFAKIRYGQAFAYVVVRYLALPMLLYVIAEAVLPSYSVDLLLLALMPAGASCAAMAAIMEANVGLALGITLVSGFLVPISVPAAFWLIGKHDVNLDLSSIFWSLIKIVILPMLIYWQGARRIPRLAAWSRHNASFFSTILIGIMIAMVVAHRRIEMIHDPLYLAEAAAVACTVFVIFYLVGWFFPFGGDRRIRLSQTLASGAMNNGLGISVSLLYFPPEVSLFMVITEIPWPLGVAIFRRLMLQKKEQP